MKYVVLLQRAQHPPALLKPHGNRAHAARQSRHGVRPLARRESISGQQRDAVQRGVYPVEGQPEQPLVPIEQRAHKRRAFAGNARHALSVARRQLLRRVRPDRGQRWLKSCFERRPDDKQLAFPLAETALFVGQRHAFAILAQPHADFARRKLHHFLLPFSAHAQTGLFKGALGQ